jgi:Fis family transcriptional regulator
MSREQNLSEIIESMVKEALILKEENVYNTLRQELDRITFEATMKMCKYNQSKTARVLGISRGTLRSSLQEHFGDKYVGTRE